MAKEQSVYDIVQGISQAAANAYDGSQYERYSYDGEARTIGLEREKGDPIVDSRVMDGFAVNFHGNKLKISYHAEASIKDLHDKNFKTEIEQKFADISSFLKKEYKKITGSSLQLTSLADADSVAQNLSQVRSWVQSSKIYQIGNLKNVDSVEPKKTDTPEERLDQSIKKWLAFGKDTYPGAKKPQNVTRKAD